MKNENKVGAYENLAHAIVMQAVTDYRASLKMLYKPIGQRFKIEGIDAAFLKTEVKHFFESKYFSNLTSVDGEILVEKLQREAETKEFFRLIVSIIYMTYAGYQTKEVK